MDAWAALAWGAFGGLAVEGLEFTAAVRRGKTWPWKRRGEPNLGPFLVSVAIRVIISGGLAAGMGSSGQVTTGFAALTVGAAAPLIFENVVRNGPSLAGGGEPLSPAAPTSRKNESFNGRSGGGGRINPDLSELDGSMVSDSVMPESLSGEPPPQEVRLHEKERVGDGDA